MLKILSHLSAKEMTLITGARQVGKTTVMKEVKDILDKQGNQTLFFNLDFETDFSYVESQGKFLQKVKLEFGDKPGFIFIDEIQRKENSGLFLKGLFDRNLPYRFIVSGSGSMELKEKIHESLTGRKRTFELSTISFREFVNFRTDYRYENNLNDFFDVEKERTELLLNEYLACGGYPRLVVESTKQEKSQLINEIYTSYLKRDVAYLLNIDRPELFTRLIQLLAHATGSILNYSTLASDVGVSVPTLKKYFWYAENTFIIKIITPYFKNKRKEIKKSPVVYFNDLGLRNFALNQFGKEHLIEGAGLLFQNFVFNIIQELNQYAFAEINFWRTTDQAEVDFIIHSGDEIVPVETKCSRLKNDRVSRSFRNFIEAYEPKNAYIVNLDYTSEMKINNTTVKFLPYYKLYQEKILE
ncbi:MAG: ATP-binding protein [Candidatus Zhuqueibacterota bacterium]